MSMWQPVATTYIRVSIPDVKLTESFAEGDTVTFNSGLDGINAGSAIQKITDTSMVIIGILPHVTHSETTTSTWQLKIERKLPDLDFVCTNNNRVWGCHYGKDARGKLTNEIYASKLGDFKNWYSFNGISTDSYAVSIGEDGRWTGCITYQGKPTFFKENAIFRVYGNMPSEYQIVTNNARGVQYGSEKSLAILNQYLIYKSPVDVVIYDGATPTSISQAFGRDRIYYDAAAGATLNKYYISMQDSIGRFYYFVYDLETNLWMREDAKNKLIQFTTSEAGQIYAHNGKVIYGSKSAKNKVWKAIEEGGDYKAALRNAFDKGLNSEKFASSITSQYKPIYLELLQTDPAEAAKLKNRLIAVYSYLAELNGKTYNPKTGIEKWSEED